MAFAAFSLFVLFAAAEGNNDNLVLLQTRAAVAPSNPRKVVSKRHFKVSVPLSALSQPLVQARPTKFSRPRAKMASSAQTVASVASKEVMQNATVLRAPIGPEDPLEVASKRHFKVFSPLSALSQPSLQARPTKSTRSRVNMAAAAQAVASVAADAVIQNATLLRKPISSADPLQVASKRHFKVSLPLSVLSPPSLQARATKFTRSHAKKTSTAQATAGSEDAVMQKAMLPTAPADPLQVASKRHFKVSSPLSVLSQPLLSSHSTLPSRPIAVVTSAAAQLARVTADAVAGGLANELVRASDLAQPVSGAEAL